MAPINSASRSDWFKGHHAAAMGGDLAGRADGDVTAGGEVDAVTVGSQRAATRAAQQAVQVADPWRLMENANAAFLEAVVRLSTEHRQPASAFISL
jgi:hypothetical protein